MTRLDVKEAQATLVEILKRVAEEGERILLTCQGREVAVLVPPEDLELLERGEDQLDLEAAQKALKEPGSIPWEELRAEPGLDSERK